MKKVVIFFVLVVSGLVRANNNEFSSIGYSHYVSDGCNGKPSGVLFVKAETDSQSKANKICGSTANRTSQFVYSTNCRFSPSHEGDSRYLISAEASYRCAEDNVPKWIDDSGQSGKLCFSNWGAIPYCADQCGE